MTFGETMQKLRKEAGWSQEECAERLGVSRQAISKWERDQSLPELEKMLRIGQIFGVSVDSFLAVPTHPASRNRKNSRSKHRMLRCSKTRSNRRLGRMASH